VRALRLAALRRRRSKGGEGDGPILAVDIDGVVSLFGFEEPPHRKEAEFELINGKMHCISIPAGERLRRLAADYELVWATGWEKSAGQISRLLDLPEWPYLTFNGAARFGSADWKLGPLAAYASGRPLAWVDDSLDEACYEWARSRKEPTLLVETEPDLGLQDVHVEALLAWARSLRAAKGV
jgi:hypothetical protein